MFIVEFYGKGKNPEFHKVFVFDYKELLQLLNYIENFDYELDSVRREYILIGYDSFKEYDKGYGNARGAGIAGDKGKRPK